MSAADNFNQHNIEEFRANHGRIGGAFAGTPMLLLHTIGARSGRPRINPMMYLADQGPDEEHYLVFASKRGADRHPDWYWNLKAHPDTRAEIDDRVLEVHAVELTGTERDEKFSEQASLYPGFADYQRRTSRVIPVVALIPRSSTPRMPEGASTDSANR